MPGVISEKEHTLVRCIGVAAATISSVQLFPQIYAVLQTRETEDISITTISMILVVSILWFTYHMILGKTHNQYHGAVAAGINGTAALVLIILILTYRSEEKS